MSCADYGYYDKNIKIHLVRDKEGNVTLTVNDVQYVWSAKEASAIHHVLGHVFSPAASAHH